ncbi:hypothetical protein [Rhizobium sp. BK661]|uniref:hypothetical protein n=1 Tax=Rhizobium sp. BK661 TaxID=2586991 RepID=UPI002168D7F2|nr:hypothetical protein [Rhizobium sp. BK661]MCS3741984.1 hypothetical protein [Rhizobium sp. BK661]
MTTKTKTGPNKKLREEGQDWIKRINAATTLEKEWLDDASIATKAYTNEDKAEGEDTGLGTKYDFNILYANVETIVPAVINSSPVPDVRRRFNDKDPAARVVADLIERAISVQIDDSRLQVELEAAAQDAFLAGRGIVRIRFRSDIVGGEPTKEDIIDAHDRAEGAEQDGAGVADADERYAGRGEGDLQQPDAGTGAGATAPELLRGTGTPERLENERITFEAVSWRDYRHGPAKRWDERPWDAFRFVIAKEDEGVSFNADLIRSQFDESEQNDWSKSTGDICGWEVWCKKTRQVKFIDDAGIILKVIDDPLGLKGFFPIPTPMQPIEITGRLKPVNPFAIYRKLADQLDTITKRIDVVTKAMKVCGWYSGSSKSLEAVMTLADDEFAPIEDGELYANSQGGIAGAMAFWPVEKFIAVLDKLYLAREQTKQAIYEITGISDIVRGASTASETATAQNIKSQWGSLRIQKMQRMMERCARDLFVMMSEIIPSRFSLRTLEEMTSIPLLPTLQDTPEQQQQKAQVVQLLKRPIASYYRIDVESDSTIRADLTRQKAEVSQFLQGAGAYFQAVGPLVKEGTLPPDAALEIFIANARMFNLGRSVEETLENMVTQAKAKAQQAQNQPEMPDPAMAKVQADAQAQDQADQRRNETELTKAKMDNDTEWKKAILEALTKIETARIQAQTDMDSATLAAQLEAILGLAPQVPAIVPQPQAIPVAA